MGVGSKIQLCTHGMVTGVELPTLLLWAEQQGICPPQNCSYILGLLNHLPSLSFEEPNLCNMILLYFSTVLQQSKKETKIFS